MRHALSQVTLAHPGQPIPGGYMLAESEPYLGDEVSRPYVIRLVVRNDIVCPFVVWTYYLDKLGGRESGDYTDTLERGVEFYKRRCARHGLTP